MAKKKKKKAPSVVRAVLMCVLALALGLGAGVLYTQYEGKAFPFDGTLFGEPPAPVQTHPKVKQDPPCRFQLFERDGMTWFSIDGFEMLVVNKTYGLPAGYGEEDPVARQALEDMFDAAEAEGLYMGLLSGYRSYETQEAIFNRYAAEDGEEKANTYSARPGHSEHQTGLAFDIYGGGYDYLTSAFGETAEFAWLQENMADHGFILRYPYGKTDVTGYIYEPWHLRYVGVDLARIIDDSGLTVEELMAMAEWVEK